MSDISACSQEELENEAVQICVLQEALTGRLMRILAELDRRGDYAKHGQATLAHWLAWRTGKQLGAAREHVRVARALVALPLLSQALLAGEISFSKSAPSPESPQPSPRKLFSRSPRAPRHKSWSGWCGG